MGYILIVGRAEDACCQLVQERLTSLGRETIFLQENQLFPGLRLVWHLDNGNSEGSVGQARQTARLAEIDGVLARFSGFPVSAEEFQTADGQYLCSEWHALMRGYLRALPCPVINRVPPELWYKPSLSIPDLLSLVPGLKFKLPKTLVATRFEDARAFFHECGGPIRYSPLTGLSNYLVDSEDSLAKLEAVSKLLPLCLSEVVPGEAVDAYVVGTGLIWDSAHPEVRPGGALAEHCLEIAASLGLAFCQFVLVRSRQDEWYCLGLSCMPDPILCGDEVREKLTERLARTLMNGKGASL